MLIHAWKTFARAALIVIAASSVASGAVPQTINYQGFLTNPGGQPINATVSLTLRLYAAAENGVALWEETLPGVGVTNGLFSVELGKVTPLNLPFDAQYFLSVQVNSDGEMSPRRPLNAVPYAFRALTPTGPPGPPGPSSIAQCPAGMTKLDFATFTICYNAGITGTWDSGSQSCYDNFRAPLCSAQQWRFAVCQAGVPNPGRSWIGTITGTATFATVAGCTGDAAGSAAYNTQFPAPCCLEWMKY